MDIPNTCTGVPGTACHLVLTWTALKYNSYLDIEITLFSPVKFVFIIFSSKSLNGGLVPGVSKVASY